MQALHALSHVEDHIFLWLCKYTVAVDQESRLIIDHCNWMFNLLVFKQIQQVMGVVQIDLFASRQTKQLPTFYGSRPDLRTDAFNQDWSQRRLEDFPRLLLAQEDLVILQSEQDFLMNQ